MNSWTFYLVPDPTMLYWINFNIISKSWMCIGMCRYFLQIRRYYIILIHLFAVCTLMDVVCTFHCVYHGNVLVFRFGKETCGFLQVILKRPSEQWKNTGWLKYNMDVSENNGTPKSSIFYGVFHYKPSSWGTTTFGKHPYGGLYYPGRFLYVAHLWDLKKSVLSS